MEKPTCNTGMCSMKKGIVIFLVFAVVLAGIAYYQSTKAPTNIPVATDNVIVSNNVEKEIESVLDSLIDEVENMSGEVLSGNIENATGTDLETSYILESESTLGWKGTKVAGSHTGSLTITNGSITMDEDTITAGNFQIDMTSLKLLDIQDEKFETELRDEFLDADTYNNSSLVITSSTMTDEGMMINADLTIKDITNPISFPATMLKNDDESVTISTEFAIDRTKRELNMRKGLVNNFLEYNMNLTFTPNA